MDFVNHTDTLTHKGLNVVLLYGTEEFEWSTLFMCIRCLAVVWQYWVLGRNESVKCCFLMMSLNENHKALTDLMK